MPDIRIILTDEFLVTGRQLDWSLLPDGSLDQNFALATAFYVALCSDRRALDSDVLPDPRSHDRKGWWGDLDAAEIWGGWTLGSRLWLLRRVQINDVGARSGSTVNQVKAFLRESLEPFISNRICTDIQMDVSRNAYNRNRIDAAITAFRGQNPPVAMQFQILWDEMTGMAVEML